MMVAGFYNNTTRRTPNPLPYPLTIPEVSRWWDGPALALANGATVDSWTERVVKDHASTAGSLITYATNVQNGLSGVVWPSPGADNAAHRFYAGYGNVHSNTNGMMIFISGKWTGVRPLIYKSGAAAGKYFWEFHVQSRAVYEDKAAALPAACNWNSNIPPREWPSATWGVVALTWTPGAAPEVYYNKVITTVDGLPAAVAVNTIEDDDGNDQVMTIGGGGAFGTGGNFNGTLGDVIIVSKHTTALRNSLFDWLGVRWNIAMP